ncbi:MAG: hypothetical protein ACPG4U_12630 [Pseudomonadales bacterium]
MSQAALNQHIEQQMDSIEQYIFTAEAFAPWRGQFEIRKVIVKKEGQDLKYDLEVRLAHWPEGVTVKVYKHKALALLPCCDNPETARAFLKCDATPSRFWKNTYNFSHRTDLDEARYVLREGNEMQALHADECVAMLHCFIEEIEAITTGA